MAKRNVSRCSIPAKGKEKLLVKIKNSSEENSRTFKLNAYDKDSETKESLSINDKPACQDTLGPGSEKVYTIDAAKVKSKVVMEIIQEKGGSGISVSSKNRGLYNALITLK
ncbi:MULTISPECIES: hypothetical protein [unclassified Cytobacillus]|jgi:hypothetical protein|uniref:hypothetical protein n=1 Tax=unclassified Cytobacillus TaxID=2675268 RepID=UPI00135CE807|nr:hypothetical protein [Cytobacillus sp. AMY 15.2]KAF0818632.1 hypothetical protein KIS4809_2691 [Bacillus sp. ZZV12-4809]MCM3092731.1 hypothetical protein [Cytobacillus sp. AMY 15.2]